MRRIFLLLALLPLCACVSSHTRALRKSPDYRAGYNDGCNSAYGPDADKRHDDTTVRDDEMFRTNEAYRTGWHTGNEACRPARNVGSGAALPSSGPIPDRNPGNGGLPN